MTGIKKLPWLKLANKVKGSGVAGALGVLLVWGLNIWIPGLGDAAGPLLEPGIVWAAAFVGGYLTPERPELWTGES